MKTTVVAARALAALLVFAVFIAAGCDEGTRVQTDAGSASLTLDKPGEVTLDRGGTAEVEISIERNGITQPVSVSFDQLPEGVRVINADAQIAGDSTKYVLEAGDEAALVENHQAKVTAEAGEAAVSELFNITVRQKQQ